MNMQIPKHSVTVRATSAASLDEELDQAVADAVEVALTNRQGGVLVTRHDHRTFIVQLTEEVPFGMTMERDMHRPDGKRRRG